MSVEAQQHASDAANERGSLLLEALVAFAILSAMMVAILSTYTVFQRANRSAIAEQDAMQAMLFLLDDMTREMKISQTYIFDAGVLQFTRISGVDNMTTPVSVKYKLDGGQIKKRVEIGPTPSYLPLTPGVLNVTSFSVQVLMKNLPTDSECVGQLCRALITITAQPTDANSAPIYLQTTLTEREQKL